MKDFEKDEIIHRHGPSPEIRAQILAMGKHFSEEMITKTMRLYIPLLRKIAQGGVKITKDLKYGHDERHRLDVHEPIAKPSHAVPMVAFFHGGGFIGGDKNTVGDLIFGNVANYFAKHGMLGINATYRLAPKHQWPEGARDVAAVVEWLRVNGAQYGGDPDRIFLFGQSAGAAHVGTYVMHEELQPEGGVGAAGAVLMSGQYNPNPRNPGPFDRAYYGSDTENYPKKAALHHIDGLKIPLFIIFAEFDPHDIEMQNIELIRALCMRDKHCPRFTRLQNHNHISEVVHLNTEDESIGPEIIDFIQTVR